MGGSSSSSRPLASVFGVNNEARPRGPALGTAMVRGDEDSSGWRVLLVGPMCIQAFEAKTAQAVPAEAVFGGFGKSNSAGSKSSGMTPATGSRTQDIHAPFTACSVMQTGVSPDYLAIGCQDGTVLVFALDRGSGSDLLHELKGELDQQEGAEESEPSHAKRSLTMSITALRMDLEHRLYAASCGRCRLWDLRTGELLREFHPPGGNARQVTPSSLVVVDSDIIERDAGASEAPGAQLWIGLDNGTVAVFDIATGVLVRSFSCTGPEVIVSLALCRSDACVFALSAHRRVSIWETSSCAFLQKYPADLITCGTDLSAMESVQIGSPDISLLFLAGIDGSLCIRRVNRRPGGKISCVLLCYLEHPGAVPGCPITTVAYHKETDSVLLGDAGCTLALLSPLKAHLGEEANADGTATGEGSASAAANPAPAAAVTAPADKAPQAPQAPGSSNSAGKSEQQSATSPFPVFQGTSPS